MLYNESKINSLKGAFFQLKGKVEKTTAASATVKQSERTYATDRIGKAFANNEAEPGNLPFGYACIFFFGREKVCESYPFLMPPEKGFLFLIHPKKFAAFWGKRKKDFWRKK